MSKVQASTANHKKNYGPHIIIDTSIVTHDVYVNGLKNDLKKIGATTERRSSELQGLIDLQEHTVQLKM